jgi:hypothetical protein
MDEDKKDRRLALGEVDELKSECRLNMFLGSEFALLAASVSFRWRCFFARVLALIAEIGCGVLLLPGDNCL